MKISEIFTKEELEYISKKRPDLIPLEIPSKNDIELLSHPSIDQTVIEFLKQYDVKVQPRSVGAWNGWDILSTISSFYAGEKGSMSNIASTIFLANRSNQVNSIAQDWATWKRWALDHKDFDTYRNEVIKIINLHNEKKLNEVNDQIETAQVNNKKISEALLEPSAKEYISEAIKRNKIKEDKQNTRLGCLILSLPIVIVCLFVFDSFIGGPAKRKQKRQSELISLVQQWTGEPHDYSLKPYKKNMTKFFNLMHDDLYVENKDLISIAISRRHQYGIFLHEKKLEMFGKTDPKKWCDEKKIRSAYEFLLSNAKKTKPQINADRNYWMKKSKQICIEEYIKYKFVRRW